MVFEPKGYMIGVTTGLNYIARELPTPEHKLMFGMTKGVDVLEWAFDVPHEINESKGAEMRRMFGALGITVTAHGELSLPTEFGERGYWAEAHDAMIRSIKSAAYLGAKYVDFHSSLYYWPEFVTRAEMKIAWDMVDENGDHIRTKLKESEELREWFVEKYGIGYVAYILGDEERRMLDSEMEQVQNDFNRRVVDRYNALLSAKAMSDDERKEMARLKKEIENGKNEISGRITGAVKDAVRGHVATGEKWGHEEIGNDSMVYDIMAHWMLFSNDRLLQNMYNTYRAEFSRKGVAPMHRTATGITWIETIVADGDPEKQRLAKEFVYGVVAAKYLQGHLTKRDVADLLEVKERGVDITIGIENPDARDPKYAGMYRLWRPKQIYALVKTMNDPRVRMIVDFEHISTQGRDPKEEIDDFVQAAPDCGSYIISLHVTTPTPTHSHQPLAIGDQYVYHMIWKLKTAGFSRGFLIYERGGNPPGESEPVRNSVTALRLIAEYLERNVPPDKLPRDFFGISSDTETRERGIIRQHFMDPLKGVLQVPEEDYTFLGRAALEKGVPPEKWKKEELK